MPIQNDDQLEDEKQQAIARAVRNIKEQADKQYVEGIGLGQNLGQAPAPTPNPNMATGEAPKTLTQDIENTVSGKTRQQKLDELLNSAK